LHRTCFPKWQRLRSFDNSPGASNAVEDQNTFQNPSHGGAALWSFGKQPSHTSCHSTQHDLESVVTRWASPNRPAPRPPRRVDHHVRGCRLPAGQRKWYSATPPARAAARVRTAGRGEEKLPPHALLVRAQLANLGTANLEATR